MDLVSRVKGILLKPKDEWGKIKGENLPVAKLFTSYAVILAAIPAVAHFFGWGIFGSLRIPYLGRHLFGRNLFYSIFSYVFSLLTVYILGIIINALAPTFSSKPNQENAMKLAVFSMTPAWIAGILNLIPFLGILASLASLYGLYIMYLGFDATLMETPKDKVVSYFVVSLVIALVLMFVLSGILGAMFLGGSLIRAL